VSELEQSGKAPKRREQEDSNTAITTTAVGVALLIAAVLVIITAGTPAAGIGFVIGGFACLGWGIPKLMQRRQALPQPANKERELLSAIRESGGGITPTEAAMETSLTVREADRMLSELAGGGHLAVESRDGALFYSLPGKRLPEIEDPSR
jgi:hypothetical protein